MLPASRRGSPTAHLFCVLPRVWCTSKPDCLRASQTQFLLKPTQKWGFIFWGAKMRIKNPLSLMFSLTTSGFAPQDSFFLRWLNFPDFQLPGKSHPTEQGWGEHSQLPQLWELRKSVYYGFFPPKFPLRGVSSKVFRSPSRAGGEGCQCSTSFAIQNGSKILSSGWWSPVRD